MAEGGFFFAGFPTSREAVHARSHLRKGGDENGQGLACVRRAAKGSVSERIYDQKTKKEQAICLLTFSVL